MTRIVHVSSAHRWSDNRIHLREAASLVEQGHEVHLVAVEHDIEVPDTGVVVHLVPQRSRYMRFLVGVPHTIWVALLTRAKVFHLHDPELIPAIPLLRMLGRTVVFDAHEDLPSQIEDKAYIPALLLPALVQISKFLVWLASASATRIVVATETIALTFPARKVVVVHNYPRLRDAETSAPALSSRREIVVYIGAMEAERGAYQMIDALAAKDFPAAWRLHIAGVTWPPSLLEELKRRPGWLRAEHHGVVGPEEARDVLLGARVGLVLFQKSRAHVDALPTKLFEYMAAGVAVIASDFPLWRTLVHDNAAGLMVDETNPEAIAAALARYAADPDLLALHGRNGREAVLRQYNWTLEADTLGRLYESL